MSAPVEFALPANAQKGIGDVILKPESERLIPGVQVIPYSLWPDDRGYFLEVAHIGQGGVSAFPPETTQISAALSLPGTVKAFHIHRLQTDYWSPASGMFQVALVDLRPDSPAFGRRNTFYAAAHVDNDLPIEFTEIARYFFHNVTGDREKDDLRLQSRLTLTDSGGLGARARD